MLGLPSHSVPVQICAVKIWITIQLFICASEFKCTIFCMKNLIKIMLNFLPKIFLYAATIWIQKFAISCKFELFSPSWTIRDICQSIRLGEQCRKCLPSPSVLVPDTSRRLIESEWEGVWWLPGGAQRACTSLVIGRIEPDTLERQQPLGVTRLTEYPPPLVYHCTAAIVSQHLDQSIVVNTRQRYSRVHPGNGDWKTSYRTCSLFHSILNSNRICPAVWRIDRWKKLEKFRDFFRGNIGTIVTITSNYSYYPITKCPNSRRYSIL